MRGINNSKVVVFGSGNLGKSVALNYAGSVVFDKSKINFLNTKKLLLNLHLLLDNIDIKAIVNCVGYMPKNNSDDEIAISNAINATAVEIIGKYCNSRSIPFINISTDKVFSPQENGIFNESSPTCPQNSFGESKLLGEQKLLNVCDTAIILRISWLYSIFFPNNFIYQLISAMVKQPNLSVATDQFGSLCNAFDLSFCIIDLIDKIHESKGGKEDINFGLYHLSQQSGVTSRYEIASEVTKICKRLFPDLFAIEDITPIHSKILTTSVEEPNDEGDRNGKIEESESDDAELDEEFGNTEIQDEKFVELDSSLIKETFDIEMPDWKFSLFNATQKITQRLFPDIDLSQKE